MKLIIAGSRSCPKDLDMVETAVMRALAVWARAPRTIEVVCGMAQGSDQLGREWAIREGLPCKEMPARWDDISVEGAVIRAASDGKPFNIIAGYMRNQKMVDYADAALFLWDGKSKGTKDCIDRAKKKGIPIYIHRL